jgi:hypothetical protein
MKDWCCGQCDYDRVSVALFVLFTQVRNHGHAHRIVPFASYRALSMASHS